jgi:hypothetical protein
MTQRDFAARHGIGLSTPSKCLFVGHPEAGERSVCKFKNNAFNYCGFW